jgi:hypothetical protein
MPAGTGDADMRNHTFFYGPPETKSLPPPGAGWIVLAAMIVSVVLASVVWANIIGSAQSKQAASDPLPLQYEGQNDTSPPATPR